MNAEFEFSIGDNDPFGPAVIRGFFVNGDT